LTFPSSKHTQPIRPSSLDFSDNVTYFDARQVHHFECHVDKEEKTAITISNMPYNNVKIYWSVSSIIFH
jgi:hypothetical protein